MGEVLTFPTPLDYRDIMRALLESKKVKHVVVVVELEDGMSELYWDRQPINGVVFAAAVLNQQAAKMAAAATIEDD